MASMPPDTAATAAPRGAAVLWFHTGPVLAVLAIVLVAWYAAAVWLNAPQTIERTNRLQPGTPH